LATCTRCGRDFCADCIINLKGAVVCAGCKADVVQDVKSGMVAGEMALATRGARFAAIFIDQFITSILVGVIMALVTAALIGATGAAGVKAPGSNFGLMILLIEIVLILTIPTSYEALMLAKRGQTLGKMALKIKVVRDDGSDISTGQAWGRAMSRGLMGITGILGFIDIIMIFSGTRTCLHDRMAKTRVVSWKR
jgi:uncharacterized RDD family membrane protein YckC